MNQAVKFQYQGKHIVFFIIWRGTQVEVLRANATLELEQVKKLRTQAQFKANDLLTVLKMAA
jgi:hypothetical protein